MTLGVLLWVALTWVSCGTAHPTSNYSNRNTHDLGYVKVAEKESTASVGAWRRSENIDNPSLTLLDMLLRVPGVRVNGSGQNATVNIRGVSSFHANTEPLFVVDGVSVGFGYRMVASMNPNEIENISVIKDSAASIYGVRGSNGVIVIESKKPLKVNTKRDKTRY